MGFAAPDITDIMGKTPSRMAFADGWIDQPFVSRLNPNPPGSMVVVSHDAEFVERLNPQKILLMPEGINDFWDDEFLEMVSLA